MLSRNGIQISAFHRLSSAPIQDGLKRAAYRACIVRTHAAIAKGPPAVAFGTRFQGDSHDRTHFLGLPRRRSPKMQGRASHFRRAGGISGHVRHARPSRNGQVDGKPPEIPAGPLQMRAGGIEGIRNLSRCGACVPGPKPKRRCLPIKRLDLAGKFVQDCPGWGLWQAEPVPARFILL
jgi:hypothetical protein